MAEDGCNPNTQEAKPWGFRMQGHPGLYRRTPPVNQGWGSSTEVSSTKPWVQSIGQNEPQVPACILPITYTKIRVPGKQEQGFSCYRSVQEEWGQGRKETSWFSGVEARLTQGWWEPFRPAQEKTNPSPSLSPTEGSSIFLTLTDISP